MNRISRRILLLSVFAAASLSAAETASQAVSAPVSKPIRIALVSDTHANRDNKEDQPLYRARLDRVIASVNAANVQVVLVAGDLTQSGLSHEFDDFKAQIASFRAPVLCVPGNHDIGPKRIPPRDPGPRPEALEVFEEKIGPSFFARDVAGLRVVALNSQLIGSDLPREGEQWTFLAEEMARPSRSPRVVLLHMPPFIDSANEPGGNYWNIEPEPRARLFALLKQGGIRTVLAGHLHRSLITTHDGVLYVTSIPASFGLPRPAAPYGWTLVTVLPGGDVTVGYKAVADPVPAAAPAR